MPSANYIGDVNTGKLEIKLKSDKNINYHPDRLAPVEREKVKSIVSDLLRVTSCESVSSVKVILPMRAPYYW